MDEVRIVFHLEPDDDGYPPVRFERLWAQPLNSGNFRIDNIPFYVYGISAEDEVEAQRDEHGELHFQGLAKASGNSTFRLYVADVANHAGIRACLEQLGCKSEIHREAGLLAVEVPKETNIRPVLDFLADERDKEKLDFEEAALRHTL